MLVGKADSPITKIKTHFYRIYKYYFIKNLTLENNWSARPKARFIKITNNIQQRYISRYPRQDTVLNQGAIYHVVVT